MKKQDHMLCCQQESHFKYEDRILNTNNGESYVMLILIHISTHGNCTVRIK